MWGHEARSSVCGEFGERCGSIVGPEDDGGSLAFGNWVEAVVLACGGNRGDADLVAVQGEINVNRLAVNWGPEGLRESEARVERDGTWEVLAEKNDLQRAEPGHGRNLREARGRYGRRDGSCGTSCRRALAPSSPPRPRRCRAASRRRPSGSRLGRRLAACCGATSGPNHGTPRHRPER